MPNLTFAFRISSTEAGTIAADDTGNAYTWGSPGYIAIDFADQMGGGPYATNDHLSVVAPSGATLRVDLFDAIGAQFADCVFAVFGTGT